ncbi:MAG: hypothetical protein ACR2JW_10305 [Thermomicrobiales bacterium]
MYDMEDAGRIIRLWYFLSSNLPSPDQFRSLAAQGAIYDNPVATYRSQGISAWATEDIARSMGTRPRVNRGRWQFLAALDLATDGIAIRIERTGKQVGHFTVFGEPQILHECVVRILPL